MPKPYFMYANHYRCPECGHEWASKGKHDEVGFCPNCGIDDNRYPYESLEVDYDNE